MPLHRVNCFWGLLSLYFLTVHAAKRYLTPAVELSYQNLSSNIEDWSRDLAIMFYAPWCKYCKQLSPSFDQIATLHSSSKDLTVGKFNCEVPSKHEGDLVPSLLVDFMVF